MKEKAAPSASLSEASAVLRCIEEQRDALKASLAAAEGEEMLYEVMTPQHETLDPEPKTKP